MILRETLEPGDGTKIKKTPEQEAEEAAEAQKQKETQEKIKAEQDEKIKKNLNNKEFLNFLQKDSEAVNNSNDDEYLRERIDLFEKVKAVKNEVKKYIVSESSSEFGSIADALVDRLENVAIKNTPEFLTFSAKISEFLRSLEKSKALEKEYFEVVKGIPGLENINDNNRSDQERLKFINEVHIKIEQIKLDFETKESNLINNRGILSRIPYTKTRAEWKANLAKSRASIEIIKTQAAKLDRNAIEETLGDLAKVRDSLQDNVAFKILNGAFFDMAKKKIEEAKKAGDVNSVSRNLDTLNKINDNKSLLTEGQFNEMASGIDKYSKERVAGGVKDLVEKKEDTTLDTYEKGIDRMKNEGLKLGLSEGECNEQIVEALEKKIDDLAKNPKRDPQANIKLILARRVLNNLTSK